MQKSLISLVFVASIAGSGCWATGVSARGAQLEAAGESAVHTSRGVYLLGGTVHLTGGEAMAECPNGLARAESEMSFGDWALSLGLGVATWVLASRVICTGTEAECQSLGLSAGAAAQALIGTRTLRWICARERSVSTPAPRVTASR